MLKKSLLLTLLLALFMPWVAQAQETLTVYEDGTATSSNVPVHGLWADAYLKCEFVVPADQLEEMTGSTISQMDFYLTTPADAAWTGTFQVFLLEVDDATISAYYGPDNATIVYEGQLDGTESTMTVAFSDNYTYGGDNLLVGVYQITPGNYKSATFAGATVTGASGQSYNSSSLANCSFSQKNFIPKTTFTYEPGQQGGDVCEKPATCEVYDVTSTSAILTWSGGSGTYNVEMKGGSYTDWTTVLEGTTLTSTTLTLQPTTSYQARVQSVCNGSTPTSGWKTSAAFTTSCDTYNIPYTYGFEEAAPFDCWTVVSGTITRIGSVSNNGTYRLDFRGTASNMIAMPQFNEATNNLRVEFYTRPESTGGSSGKFAIGYMTDITDASTFVAVATYNSTEMTTSYVKKTVDLVGVPADANIAMRQFDCSTNYYWYVDDVTVKEIPSCLTPTGLTADASTTSAELSWTANSGETAWTLYWKKTTDENYTEIANATNPYLLNGLTTANNYEYYVVANCSADDASEPSEVFTFATLCETIVALGYTENFDSYTAGNNVLPSCWNYINTTTNSSYNAYPRVNAYNAYSGSSCLYFYSYYSSWGNYDPQPQYAILPEMSGMAGLQVTLMARGGSSTSTFKIGTMSDPTDASTFTMIAEQELTTSYPDNAFEYVIPASCTDNYLAIMIDAASSSRTSNSVYIDDIVICEVPSCIKPTGLAVTEGSITHEGATITWTAVGSETEWQIEFAKDADFTDPLYETVQDNPTYTFQGLDEMTTYYVHVQAVCGGNDGSSEYSTTVSFTTLQTAVNLPYTTDFERSNDWRFVNGDRTNAWAYGEATSNGGTHALYISNDGGTTNAYTLNSASTVFATKLFNFEAGTYVFSYDWMANGESTYDYLRVALVPSTVTLTAGTNAPAASSGYFYNNLPDGWIALDGGSKLNLKDSWQSIVSDEIEITTAGTYMMVFAWTDDTSGGSQPPAAIDNVSIELITCHVPTGLAVNDAATTSTSVELSWTETGEATSWQIELTDEEDNTRVIDADRNPFTLDGLTAEKMYAARVRAYCDTENQSHWSEEIIFETAAECQTPDGLAATASSNNAVISWNGYGQEKFNLRYGTDGENWTTETEVGNPYTLTPLNAATTYYVQVQPTCADAETWSATCTFSTLCDAIVVTSSWSEGFEDGALSVCWGQDGNNTWTVGSGDAQTSTPAGSHSGDYNALIKHGTTGDATKLITPVLDLTSLNNPVVTFWFINRKWVNDVDKLTIYYRTAPDAAWTQIDATEGAHASWTMASYILPNPSATYQIAFEMTDGYGYGVGIDDITIYEALSCNLDIAGYEDGSNGGYFLIASPLTVDPSTVEGMILTGDDAANYDLYYFDESAETEWRNYKQNPFNLEPGKGYLYAQKATSPGQIFHFTLTGAPYNGNPIKLQKTGTGSFAGWNLIGNPYDETAYLPSGRDFYVMKDDGTEIITGEGSVAAMQGVFVIANSNGEEISFSTEAPNSGNDKFVLNVSNNRGNLIDRAIVRFGEGQYLPKFQLNENSTKVFFEKEGNDYAVVYGEAEDSMPLFFKPEENGRYNFDFKAENVDFAYLHLIDSETGEDIDLIQSPSYSFDALTTDPVSRFKIVYAKTTTGVNENFAFISDGQIILTGAESGATIQLIDALGRVVVSKDADRAISTEGLSAGVYVIRLINGSNIRTQKIVVE